MKAEEKIVQEDSFFLTFLINFAIIFSHSYACRDWYDSNGFHGSSDFRENHDHRGQRGQYGSYDLRGFHGWCGQNDWSDLHGLGDLRERQFRTYLLGVPQAQASGIVDGDGERQDYLVAWENFHNARSLPVAAYLHYSLEVPLDTVEDGREDEPSCTYVGEAWQLLDAFDDAGYSPESVVARLDYTQQRPAFAGQRNDTSKPFKE